jgi:hypothetical protein
MYLICRHKTTEETSKTIKNLQTSLTKDPRKSPEETHELVKLEGANELVHDCCFWWEIGKIFFATTLRYHDTTTPIYSFII